MSKPSTGSLRHRLSRSPSSLRSTSSSASPSSVSSSSSLASTVVTTAQVADNFTLPAGSSTLTTEEHPERLIDPDVPSDASSAAPEADVADSAPSAVAKVADAPAARRPCRAAFWGKVSVAVLAATVAVVVAANVALALYLFASRGNYWSLHTG